VAQWDDYLKFEKAVVADEGTFIQLIGAGAAAPENQAASNPEAAALVQQAFAEIRAKNYETATAKLDQAKKLNPAQFGVSAGYGYIDMWQHRDEDGIAEYRTEIKNHPENLDAYRTLAFMQLRAKHEEEAIETCRALLKAAPEDVPAHRQLASILVQRKRSSEAVPVLQEAIKLAPDDAYLKVMLGTAQITSGARDEGASTLRTLLNSSSDENILNDAAYALADAGLELPLARSSCERALSQYDELTSRTTLSALTDKDLSYVTHIAATWDTMAWILYRQGETAQAEEYARASWMLDQRPTIGLHLGEIYEKQGKKDEAVRVYRLAIASSVGADTSGVDDAKARLKQLGEAEVTANNAQIQEELGTLRSSKLANPSNAKGSADFFLLFSSGPGISGPKTSGSRIEDLQFVTGDASIKSLEPQLREARFDVPFPPGSNARLVRRGILFCSEAIKGCQFTLILPENTKRTP
jgi:tetratricopeptide (TPR) repeat protein